MARNDKKEGVIKRCKCQIFGKEEISKILKFHSTSKKSQSSFQGQLEECISLLFFVFFTIIPKSRILTCRFFDFILVSKLLNLDFFLDIVRLLELKKYQINKLFVWLFNQYDLAQVVNSISQVGSNIDFPELFNGF